MARLLKFLQPFKAAIGVVLGLLLLQSLAQLYLPTLMSDIVDTGIVKGDTGYILRTGGWMLLVTAGGAICMIIASYLSAKIGAGFGKILRSRVFACVESFSLPEYHKFGAASLITRTTNDITQVQQVTTMMLRMMISAPLTCIGGIIMAVSKDAQLSLVLVAAIPILAATVLLVSRKTIPLFHAMQKKIDKLNLVVREELTGVRVIRAFNRTDHEKQRFSGANLDLTDTAIKVNIIMAVMMPIMMLLMSATSLAVIWFGGIRIDAGGMQVGDLMAFIQYVMQIMFSLLMVTMLFIMIPRASASAKRINEVLDTAPTITDPDQAQHKTAGRGLLEFRHVTFSYPGAEQPAVRDITFSAGPGQVTAIIGGTGAGKSTLISLIPRFYDIDSGQILVDGVDIRQMTQESLRARIGFVPQQTVLFSGSVADNIRYGKDDAGDDELEQAAAMAQAADFIGAMDDDFNSPIAQGGTNVSGGQKQRLAIARALIRHPEIYVFDDSFSALDFQTDARLRAALKKVTADATVIIVAQRVSTVMDADQVIVLDEGRIAGIGNHKQLLKTCEVYKEIIASQLSEEELA